MTDQKAGRKEWVGLAVLCLACLLYVMDLTILHLAVPAISADLRPSSSQLLWIIDIYGFMIAGSLITMGTLGDRIGRRRLLLIGAAAFGAMSIIAAFSTSSTMLIVTRALLGIAGATLAPSTLSLIRNMFLDPRQRAAAIGVWISSFSIGGAIGPILGGLVLEFFWWGAAFLVAVPVMAVLLIFGPRLLPEYKDENAGSPDITSAALSLGAVLAIIYGLKDFAQNGTGPIPLIAAIVGVVLGVAFVRRQHTLEDPFIDLAMFRVPQFSASLLTYGTGIFLVFGAFLFLPQYFQLVLGLSPFQAGLWTLPEAVAFVIGTNTAPRIARYIKPAWLMAGGLVVAAGGFLVLTQLDANSGFTAILVSSSLFALGTSPLFTLTNDLIIGSAPPERAGSAAGLSETAAELGGAVGIAFFGSIGVAIYRGAMIDAIPAGISQAAADTARDTLGGAVEIAATLPAEIGAGVLAAAQGAFIDGLHVGAALSGIASILLAFFVVRLLRDARLGGEMEEPSEDLGSAPGTTDPRMEPVMAES